MSNIPHTDYEMSASVTEPPLRGRPPVTGNTATRLSDVGRDDRKERYRKRPWWHQLKYMIAGIGFGIVLVKAQVISWWRIQEMFRLQSFHMYGVIGSAVIVGIMSVWGIKKFNIKTVSGEPIVFQTRKFNKGQILGGLLFGFGWAITGACPGPLFAQIGAGSTVIIVTLVSAIIGTWVYGLLREKLPH